MSTVPSDEISVERLGATIERYETEPDICTIHPVNPPERERTTAWITAEEGSFLPIEKNR